MALLLRLNNYNQESSIHPHTYLTYNKTKKNNKNLKKTIKTMTLRQNLTSLLLISSLILGSSCSSNVSTVATSSSGDMKFSSLATTWDEGIPLGNSELGALIWQNGNSLRLSLDRVDLWDLRKVDSLSGDNYRYSWIKEQVRKNDYLPVQKKFDHPYDDMAAPSKIPGAALEFDLSKVGEPQSVELTLSNAMCDIKWANGMQLQSFVQATKPVGWIRISGAPEDFTPTLLAPRYEREGKVEDLGPVNGLDLVRLGYTQGKIEESENTIVYHQKGSEGFFYDVAVRWERDGDDFVGVWSITSSLVDDKASDITATALKRGMGVDYQEHAQFWSDLWAQSTVIIPDSVLQRQYNQEIYKLGSVARENSYPISLQAVWTADNGNLPPWKGDYHHDLNTQLSYWPAYTGNYLELGMGYLNTLWNQRELHKSFTKEFYEVSDGLNVPGVTTLTGEPMGGWIQYSLSPTTAAWLSQHFYLHYKYSKDEEFLRNRAYPYIKDVATFLEQVTIINESGERTLEISSSPEIFDNSIKAWFKSITNYDLALINFCFKAAGELAAELGLSDEAAHWAELRGQLPAFDIDEQGSMTFAKGFPYNSSHRHFSHQMAIHPLGLIDWSHGEESKRIIRATIERIDEKGSDYWTGYTFSWVGNLKARAMDGDGAKEALRTFAECFCLSNSFHANGDQSGTGKSLFTYRPFTLEGNFAFASGIQDMLLQSHTSVIRIFPAIPSDWKDVEFRKLRAQGALLISAKMSNGKVEFVELESERGGEFEMANPFDGGGIMVKVRMSEGEKLRLTNENVAEYL